MNAAVSEHDRVASGPERGQPIAGRRALDSLPSRARTTSAAAAARSRTIRRLRIALPIVAAVLIAAFIFNTQSNTIDEAFLEDFEDLTAATEKRMANPRFAGIDDEGKPFEILADWAVQTPDNENVLDLEKPRAVQGVEGDVTVVTAETGVYQSEENILELVDNVTLEHSIGQDLYIFRSPAATVSIDDEVVTSSAGVGGQGPDGGALKADRMRAYNAEGRVVFEGNVSMRIYPKTKDEPAENASGDAPGGPSGAQTAPNEGAPPDQGPTLKPALKPTLKPALKDVETDTLQ